MSLDLATFSAKLVRLRKMFEECPSDLAAATGISVEVLAELEAGTRTPTGDEVLILADHFLCDFRYFISNESAAPIERTEKLFRAHHTELKSADRWAIQEFLFLSECEAFVCSQLDPRPSLSFVPRVSGTYAKGHGFTAAAQLRKKLGYGPRDIPDVFSDLRGLGVRVFRRRLANRNISGLFVNHPTAGGCVLVNYDEDPYRQRFTAAHEAAHAFFDASDEYVVSTSKASNDLRESRANAFAGAFLVPPELTAVLGEDAWTVDRLLATAKTLRVNAKVLLIALQRDNVISKRNAASLELANLRLRQSGKNDPELPATLAPAVRERKQHLMERGISTHYAELCFEAYRRQLITFSRLAEMFLADEAEVRDIATLFNVRQSI